MGRAISLNWEIDIDGKTIYPKSIGEFSPGEEGRIDVADGDRKYKIRNQIREIGEVQVTILLKKDRYEYDIMNAFARSGRPRDIFVIGRDAEDKAAFTYRFKNCDCTEGKKSAFDRSSKTEDTLTYFLIPDDIEEM